MKQAGVYVDGVTIHRGDYSHVYTLAVGLTQGKKDTGNNCPKVNCNYDAKYQENCVGKMPPTFVGNNFQCDSTNISEKWDDKWYPPMGFEFEVDFKDNGKNEDFVVRICSDQETPNEDT